MGTGYVRNDTPNNIADGNVINASDLDGEFDAVQAAFNASSGHSHDGTAGEGPQIAAGGLASNAVTTVKITDANVTLAKMAANSVDSDQYVDGSIDTAHIADNAVTAAKLDETGTYTVAGLNTTGDVSFGDNDKAIFGAGSDLQIYHDAAESIIEDVGTGDLKVRGSDEVKIQVRNAANTAWLNAVVATDAGAVTLSHNNSAKLATTATGIDVTGVITTDGMTTSADINFGDNDKAIFGAGSDLQLFHDASNSYVKDAGTGSLIIEGANVQIQDTQQDLLAKFNNAGAVQLYHVDSGTSNVKLATATSGVNITGNIDFSGGILRSNSSVQFVMDADNNGGEVFAWGHNASNATTNELMRLTSAGSLGIGTAPNAASKLHVSGGRSYFASNSNAYATYLRYDDSTAGVFVGSPSANAFQVSTSSGALRLKVDAEGRLTSSGTGSGDIGIFKTSANSGTGLYINSQTTNQIDLVGYDGSSSNSVNIRAGGATGSGLTVNTSNNVGIGTKETSLFNAAGSTAKLVVTGSTTSTNIAANTDASIVISNTSTTAGNTSGLHFARADTDDTPNFAGASIVAQFPDTQATGQYPRGELAFLTSTSANAAPSEKMRITTDGKVAIGDTASVEKLRVSGNIEVYNDDVDGYIVFHDPNTRSWSAGSDRSTGRFVISSVGNLASNLEFQIDGSGNVIATGNVTAYSDERLKSDITTIDNALDKVTAMRGVTFTKDGEAGSGVIAQELEKIAPELVMDGEEYKSVAYGNLVGYLIEAVKELSAKVEALENGSTD